MSNTTNIFVSNIIVSLPLVTYTPNLQLSPI